MVPLAPAEGDFPSLDLLHNTLLDATSSPVADRCVRARAPRGEGLVVMAYTATEIAELVRYHLVLAEPTDSRPDDNLSVSSS